MTTGQVTPIPVDDAFDQLDLAADLIHMLRHETEDTDSVAALGFVEQLIDGLIHDIDRGDLMVGRCEQCDKVHIWRLDTEDGAS